ncbi:MAG: DsbA family oxidoreductase [Synergistaceae bacterium]|nr:DsbA family oxidoreductase [Synergistaceae bacterium]
MKVIYWSDYACPFCYIGATVLKKAFANLNSGGKLELVMKSFELDPTASRNVTSTTPERFAKKYGMTTAQATARINAISEMGHEAGLDFRYSSTKYTNTLDAHRLTKLAQDKYSNDTAEKLSTNLYDAYFTRNLELADPDVLIHEGIDAGLSEADIKAVLDGNAYEADVRNDENEAYSKGIHSVPFFVVEGKYHISGAQSLEAMTETLRKGLDAHSMSCGIEGCKLS